MSFRDLAAYEVAIAIVLILSTLGLVVIGWATILGIYLTIIRSIQSIVKSISAWIDYFSDDRIPDLPDKTKSVTDRSVRRRRGPPVHRDPSVEDVAARAIARRRSRHRRRSIFVLIGIASLIPIYVGYNVWIDVLAERRTIRVNHETSSGTEELPRNLTADMTIVTDGSAIASSACSVTLRWPKAGTERIERRTILDSNRISIRGILQSEGIRDSPHYERIPVTLTTKGCLPWRVELSE